MPKRFFLIFVLCSIYRSFASANEPLTIVYGAQYKPFAWEESGVATGIQRDFVHEILVERLGLPVVHEILPWKRAQRYVRTGRRDAFFTVPTPERATYTMASALPFYETYFVMHTGLRNPKLPLLREIDSLEDLARHEKIRHIYMLGSGWHEKSLVAMKQVATVSDATVIPLLLSRGRADVYIEQYEMFLHQAKTLGVTDDIVSLTDQPLEELGWHLFIAKSSPRVGWLEEINALLYALRESGELEQIRNRIFAKYGVD